MMEKVRFGVKAKDRSEQKTREATENLNKQKSLGVYHGFACQTIASTKEKCLTLVQLFRGELDKQTEDNLDIETRKKKCLQKMILLTGNNLKTLACLRTKL
jgi:hypothetical protein